MTTTVSQSHFHSAQNDKWVRDFKEYIRDILITRKERWPLKVWIYGDFWILVNCFHAGPETCMDQ